MTKNEHTGKTLMTSPQTKEYADGWERIFGKTTAEKVVEEDIKQWLEDGIYKS